MTPLGTAIKYAVGTSAALSMMAVLQVGGTSMRSCLAYGAAGAIVETWMAHRERQGTR